jgi:hypothetical protein
MEEGKNDEMKKTVGFKRMSGSSFETEIGVDDNTYVHIYIDT